MCELCEEYGEGNVYCVDCGRMICFDVEHDDDVIAKAYVTLSGDLLCRPCGLVYDQECEREDEEYYPGLWDD